MRRSVTVLCATAASYTWLCHVRPICSRRWPVMNLVLGALAASDRGSADLKGLDDHRPNAQLQEISGRSTIGTTQ
jgi:hypothetical protein